MITSEMAHLIRHNTVAFVATVTPDGRPAVSPKATVVVLGEDRLAFLNLRSPHTIRNLAANPAVELNFIDVFRRKAVRIAGHARHHEPGSDGCERLLGEFTAWREYFDRMKGIVEVAVEEASMVLSPAYDVGITEPDLIRDHFERYRGLIESGELTASDDSG